MKKKDQETHAVFIPGFTPPPITKDWERSFYTPLIPKTHYAYKENARLLKAQHFLFEDYKTNNIGQRTPLL